MSLIVTIAGSASASASSSAVLEAARRMLRRDGHRSEAIVLRNLPAAEFLHRGSDSSHLAAVHCLIERAQALIIAIPQREAAYAGLLKTFLDALPAYSLQDKALLPILTESSSSLSSAREEALKSIRISLKGSLLLPALAFTTAQIQFEHGGVVRLEQSGEGQLRDSLDELVRPARPQSPPPIPGPNQPFFR
jgi:NAD(P)H-dependent FMN reductase